MKLKTLLTNFYRYFTSARGLMTIVRVLKKLPVQLIILLPNSLCNAWLKFPDVSLNISGFPPSTGYHAMLVLRM